MENPEMMFYAISHLLKMYRGWTRRIGGEASRYARWQQCHVIRNKTQTLCVIRRNLEANCINTQSNCLMSSRMKLCGCPNNRSRMSFSCSTTDESIRWQGKKREWPSN